MCRASTRAYNQFMTPDGSFSSPRSGASRAGAQRVDRLANEQAGLPREDLAAALQARRELGPDYDAAFAESLVERIDQTIEARLHGGGSPQGHTPLEQAYLLKLQQDNARGERKVSVGIAVVSLIASIPLSGIAAGMHSLAFLVIIWTGIVLINMAHAIRRHS
jgi:hypothetical protein